MTSSKLKTFVLQRTHESEKTTTEWKKILASHIPKKRFISGTYKEHLQPNNKKKI